MNPPPATTSGGLVALGIDLAGSPRRSTGACALSGTGDAVSWVLGPDGEIDALAAGLRPDVVLVDAPLSLPRGRRTIGDRSGPHFRECDRELRRLGIRFFPLTLGPMRMLTARGMRLARRLRAMGLRVEEGYPGGAQDLLGIARKQHGVARLQRSLRRLGIRGDLARRSLTHDELDAVTLAWVGLELLRGMAVAVGDPREGTIVLPADRAPGRSKRSGPRSAGTDSARNRR